MIYFGLRIIISSRQNVDGLRRRGGRQSEALNLYVDGFVLIESNITKTSQGLSVRIDDIYNYIDMANIITTFRDPPTRSSFAFKLILFIQTTWRLDSASRGMLFRPIS